MFQRQNVICQTTFVRCSGCSRCDFTGFLILILTLLFLTDLSCIRLPADLLLFTDLPCLGIQDEMHKLWCSHAKTTEAFHLFSARSSTHYPSTITVAGI